MIQILTCMTDESGCERITDLAIESCHRAALDCEVLIQSGHASEAARFLESCRELCLATIEVTSAERDKLALGVRDRHPENLLLLLLNDLTALERLVNQGAQPSAVLLAPFDHQRATDCYTRMMERFRQTRVPEDECVTLHFGRQSYRLPFSSILYMEAQEKRVAVYTRMQCVTITESLHSALELLDSRFIQCHRSYAINLNAVSRVDYARLECELLGGARVPISRSMKKTVAERLGQSGGNN